MFERFTTDARRVIARASELADSEASPWVRRHHLLLALVESPTDIAQAVFAAAAIDAPQFEEQLRASLRESEESDHGSSARPLASGAKKAIELALREALSLGHNHIAAEHLLLGILRSADGPLAATLAATNLRYGEARDVVRRHSAEAPRRRAARWGGAPRRRGASPGRSRGVEEVLRRAAARAQERPMTTGDLLVSLAEVPGTHFASLVQELPDVSTLRHEADRLVAESTPDASPTLVQIDPRSGAVTLTDPVLAAQLSEKLANGELSSDAIAAAIQGVLGGAER